MGGPSSVSVTTPGLSLPFTFGKSIQKANLCQFATLETSGSLGRVLFRKVFWDRYRGKDKNVLQSAVCNQEFVSSKNNEMKLLCSWLHQKSSK